MALNINPQPYEVQGHDQFEIEAEGLGPVSYTHLTLPTILIV